MPVQSLQPQQPYTRACSSQIDLRAKFSIGTCHLGRANPTWLPNQLLFDGVEEPDINLLSVNAMCSLPSATTPGSARVSWLLQLRLCQPYGDEGNGEVLQAARCCEYGG